MEQEYGKVSLLFHSHNRRGRRGQRDDDSEMLVSTRPSNANTLFDFLGDKFSGDEKQPNHHHSGEQSRCAAEWEGSV